ncbi:MAG: hypothetical protein ABGX04_09805 [Myxococcales bacterium]
MSKRAIVQLIASVMLVSMLMPIAGCSEEEARKAIKDMDIEGKLEDAGDKIGTALEDAGDEASKRAEEAAKKAKAMASAKLQEGADQAKREAEKRLE